MLPIIDGSTRSFVAIKTDGGKKRYAMSYSFHIDTGEVALKTGRMVQEAAEKGYDAASRFVRRKYREMKVKRTLNNVRKSLMRKIKFDMPIDLKALRSRVKEVVHA